VTERRARALIICTRPQYYAPSRVDAAARYLEALANATAEELVVAKRAHLFVQQALHELPERKPAAEAVTKQFADKLASLVADAHSLYLFRLYLS